MEEVRGRARWRNPELKSRVDATQPSVVGGAGPTISARVVEEYNRVSGQELSKAEKQLHADMARAAKVKELDARRK